MATVDLVIRGGAVFDGSEDYVATIKTGVVIYRDGRPTGALPGKLVRGRQAAPALMAAE